MKKSALILLVAVAISTVSCVDNAVSPQVEAIRSQQVEWMKAKTAGEVALNDAKTALNAYTAASYAISLKSLELGYAGTVIANEQAAMVAKLAIAVAKTSLDAELAKAALAIAAAGDAKAEAALARYKTEATTLVTTIGDRLDKQVALVNQEFIVAADPKDLASYLVGIQSNIDAEEAKLVGYNAAIALYNNIQGRNSDSYKAELDALLLRNRALEVTKIKLMQEITRNNIALDLFTAPFNTKTTERKDQDDSRKTKTDRIDAIDGSANVDGANDKEIATLTAEILVLNASIAKLDAELVVIVASQKDLVASSKSKNDLITANGLIISKDVPVITALENVILALKDNALSGEGLVSANTTAIAGLKTKIASSEGLIISNTLLLDSKSLSTANTNAKKLVATLTKEIALADVEIAAQEKIVAYWKGLLDKIFTA